MFRSSPYYTNVREQVYSEINYQLTQELVQMENFIDPTESKSKKSASKQQFYSMFYQTVHDQDQNIEDKIILKCSNCSNIIISQDIQCSNCNTLLCSKCIDDCSQCGISCCKICSSYQYQQNGDFIVCLSCDQESQTISKEPE